MPSVLVPLELDYLIGGLVNAAPTGPAFIIGNPVNLHPVTSLSIETTNSMTVASTATSSLNDINLNAPIVGTPGNDTLYGGLGNDQIYGLEGHDILAGDAGNDILFGGQGFDLLFGGEGDDQLYGNEDNDFLFGDSGNDTLGGGKGNDRLHGGEGADFLQGKADNDFLNGNAGNDVLEGNAGRDYLNGEDGNDLLYGGEDTDLLIANAGDDTLVGGRGNDTLLGDEGNDVLVGVNANPDMGRGQGEVDFLAGGAGADRFILGDVLGVHYNDGNPATQGFNDYGIVSDLDAQDTIQLAGVRGDYILTSNFSIGFRTGTAIFWINDGSANGTGELIALVANTNAASTEVALTFV